MSFGEKFSYGVIAGYYGDIWKLQEFIDYAPFCHEFQHQFFIYAPKNDPSIRKKWYEQFDEEKLSFLSNIKNQFAKYKVKFGIALSPYGNNQFDKNTKIFIKNKIFQINQIKPDILAIFFDDIRKKDINPKLAQNQLNFAENASQYSNAKYFVTVPTYYSYDETLTRKIGKMPKDYLEQFARIEQKFDIFWTGEHIISRGYDQSEIEKISSVFKRKPFIWDNYPVNDTKYLKTFLNIFAISARSKMIAENTAGIAFNTMQQPYMSMIPIATAQKAFFQQQYNERTAYLEVLDKLCGKQLANEIDNYLNCFILKGNKNIENSLRKKMNKIFANFTQHNQKKFTTEILQFINKYQ